MDDLKRFLPWREEIRELDMCRMKLDFSTFDQQRHQQVLVRLVRYLVRFKGLFYGAIGQPKNFEVNGLRTTLWKITCLFVTFDRGLDINQR